MQDGEVPKESSQKWFLDSGCSRHMTGEEKRLMNVVPSCEGTVKYGDGSKGKILAEGELVHDNVHIEHVLLVQGLRSSLLSISQLCDAGFLVQFDEIFCMIFDKKTHELKLLGYRSCNVYIIDLNDVDYPDAVCFNACVENSDLWHKRLGHISMHTLQKLLRKQLVKGLPSITLDEHLPVCDACRKGKQTRASFKSVLTQATSCPLELLHMDLIGPIQVTSLGGARYAYVIVDDYSRYTWVRFLGQKSETFENFEKLVHLIENQSEFKIKTIRSDRGTEFINKNFLSFCEGKGIKHQYSVARTPEQNGVVERKNRSLIEMTRTMLCDSSLPRYFWAEAMNTACYIINRTTIRAKTDKTSYELWKGRKPALGHVRVFGCKCFVHVNDREHRDKFDPKVDVAYLVGYSSTSRAYRVFNRRTLTLEESIHVTFDEHAIMSKEGTAVSVAGSKVEDDTEFLQQRWLDFSEQGVGPDAPAADAAEENEAVQPLGAEETAAAEPTQQQLPRDWKYAAGHPREQILGDPGDRVRTRSSFRHACQAAFVSTVEPLDTDEALQDAAWVSAMQEELVQFERNQVWELVPRPENYPVVGCKWVFRNKHDEHGKIVRNKARLVAKGYSQVEGIDFHETFAPVARIEAVRLLMAYACAKNITLCQMDVKSAFLNGILDELVFVEQPPGFESHEHPQHVFKLKKALYGLKQAPRAWYSRLSSYLLDHGFKRGTIDKTLFIKNSSSDILLAQVYVDDIIFGATNQSLSDEFSRLMSTEFEMSLVGELRLFLGLQVKQTSNGVFICQTQYIKDLLKKYGLENCKPANTPMGTNCRLEKTDSSDEVDQTLYRGMIGSLLYLTASRPDIAFSVGVCARYQACPRESHLKCVKRIFKYLHGTRDLGLFYPRNSSLDLVGYCDADYAGCKMDRCSTSGLCHFLGSSLISWSSKKQMCVALSTAESEYIAAGSCCTQLLWLQYQLRDFGVEVKCSPILCDNSSAINISKNPVQHSRTKHIDVRYHFLKEHVEQGDVVLNFVKTENQLADIFTKPLPFDRFCCIRGELGMLLEPKH